MTSSSSTRGIARGAAWLYAATITSALVQLAYAAVTSRLVGADGFGAYAVALAAAALISLVAVAGLPAAVGRMVTLEPQRLKSLAMLGWLLGLLAGGVLLVSANVWAALWRSPESVGPIRLLAVAAAVAPTVALLTALARRISSFRFLAISLVATNVLGMALGVAVVAQQRSAMSLVVSAVVAQATLAAVLGWRLRREFGGKWSIAHAKSDVRYNSRLTVSRVIAYFSGNVGRWAITTSVGASAMGQWNRAEVVSTVPLHQLQSAMIQAVYPEFRHDRAGSQRAFRVWADMLSLVAWVVVPVGAVGAAVVGPLVPWAFGPGWELAARVAPILFIVGGVQCVVMLLSAALEALGVFRWLWTAQAVGLVVQVAGAVGVVVTESVIPALVSLSVWLVAFHGVDILAAARMGYLDVRRLATAYLLVATVSLVAWGGTSVSVWYISHGPTLVAALASVAALLIIAAGAWKARRHLPPVIIARRYGLLRGGT